MYREKLSMNNMASVKQSNLKSYTPINLKIGEDTVVTTTLEDIKESLERSFYENLGLGVNRK